MPSLTKCKFICINRQTKKKNPKPTGSLVCGPVEISGRRDPAMSLRRMMGKVSQFNGMVFIGDENARS